MRCKACNVPITYTRYRLEISDTEAITVEEELCTSCRGSGYIWSTPEDILGAEIDETLINLGDGNYIRPMI